MTITQFRRTTEGRALRKHVKEFESATTKWSNKKWKDNCIWYACVHQAFESFFDEEANHFDIRDDVTAEDIWFGVQSWFHSCDYRVDILAVGDEFQIQFEEAFECAINQ